MGLRQEGQKINIVLGTMIANELCQELDACSISPWHRRIHQHEPVFHRQNSGQRVNEDGHLVQKRWQSVEEVRFHAAHENVYFLDGLHACVGRQDRCNRYTRLQVGTQDGRSERFHRFRQGIPKKLHILFSERGDAAYHVVSVKTKTTCSTRYLLGLRHAQGCYTTAVELGHFGEDNALDLAK